jgi:hypothetical protein
MRTCSKNKRQKGAADMRGFGLDFRRLFMRTSCARAHRLATPRPARRGEASEYARVYLPFSSPPHTYKCIKSNSPYK